MRRELLKLNQKTTAAPDGICSGVLKFSQLWEVLQHLFKESLVMESLRGDYLEKPPADTGRTCTLQTEKAQDFAFSALNLNLLFSTFNILIRPTVFIPQTIYTFNNCEINQNKTGSLIIGMLSQFCTKICYLTEIVDYRYIFSIQRLNGLFKFF